ncbi:hypothetical protein BJV82DRAFT_294239 [Fennellomyces sp. T-0311]|nr:hypothetical protein BJV82DRAFT_294239 [Fennellomyces sp. T-0311]
MPKLSASPVLPLFSTMIALLVIGFMGLSLCVQTHTLEKVTQEEKVVVKENDTSLGFYFDSTPSDVVVDEVSCSEPHSQHDNESSVLGFHFDSSKHEEQQQQPKKSKGKERAKRKIIPSDDIYLGSSSEDDKSEHGIDDDDIAVMRDYIENVRLDDEDDLEALRAFANGTDPSATHQVYEISSEDDSDDIRNVPGNDVDTVENGGFDHESEDESVQEISEDEFRQALQDSLDQVPPSLQTGIRNRIKESRREKKIAKKQKQMDKRATKQAKREHEGNNVQLRKLDKRIRVFIMDDQLSSYQVAPMSKFCRRQLHLLATAYKLKSYSFGTGAQRTPVLQKTRDTCLPKDRRYIERFLDEAQSTIDAQSSILRKHRMENAPSFHNKKGKSGKKDKKRKEKDKVTINPVHNTVVGADAAPIGDSNVGHRMLAAMGWKQGDALGVNNEGITAPIEAVIRKKRQGLGS